MKHPQEKNLYIRISNFGYENPGGFTQEELEINLDLNTWEKKIVNKQIQDTVNGGQYINTDREGHGGMIPIRNTMFLLIEDGKYILNHDAYFNYIDYLELQAVKEQSEKAEKHAQSAGKYAIVAIVIAIATALISICLTVWQIKSPVELDYKQLNEILNNSKDETHFNISNIRYKYFYDKL